MMGGRYYNRYQWIWNTILSHYVPVFLLHFQFAKFVDSVDDIIDHYKKEQIVEGYNLKEPVSVQVTASRPVCCVFSTTSHHNLFLYLLQHQEQVFTDTVDGREIYNTIRRKTKDAFYKNIVKKGYLLFNKGMGSHS